MRCPRCSGAIIHDLGDSLNGPRDYCMACGRELKRIKPKEGEGEKSMSYHLDSKKEEDVKLLLRTHSMREIVAKTGVSFNTILRIRNENLTEEEKATLKKSANIRCANKRELKKRESRAELQNDGQNIPSTDRGGEEETMEKEPIKGKICTNKKCKMAGQVQSLENFSKNRANSDGFEYHCKKCKARSAQDRRDRIEKEASGSNGRKKRQPQNPGPSRSQVTLDAQLAIDLKTIKKRVAAEVLQIYHEGGQRAVEEAFA